MKILTKLILALLITSMVWPVNLWATTYYADKLLPGSDSNNGTAEATPFLTAAKCASVAINPGDTCLIKNGTYLDEATIQITHSGTAGNPITLKNFPGHTPILRWSDNTNTNNRIYIWTSTAKCNSAPDGWIVIEGLEIDSGYNGVKVECGHDITIQKMDIHHTWFPGINIIGTNITIDRNYVHHTGDFATCTDANPDKHTHNIYVTGQNYTITNNLFSDACFYGAQLAAYPFGTFASPNASYAGFSGLVANNTFAYAQTRAGMNLWNPGGGISNTTVENNIFFENAQVSTSSSQGIDYVSCGSCVATIKNNVWYGTGTSTVFSTGSCGGCASTNTTNANPLFVNGPATVPASPDFHLQSSSPAIGAGVNLSGLVPVDFAGTSRTVPYDIGAYAYGAAAPTPPSQLNLHLNLRRATYDLPADLRDMFMPAPRLLVRADDASD